jgi:hypothetical protein
MSEFLSLICILLLWASVAWVFDFSNVWRARFADLRVKLVGLEDILEGVGKRLQSIEESLLRLEHPEETSKAREVAELMNEAIDLQVAIRKVESEVAGETKPTAGSL